MRHIDLTENKRKNVIIGILAVLVLALLAFLLTQANGTGGEAAGGITLRIDDGAVPAAQQPKDLSPGSEGIKIPGYGSITIPAGETDVQVSLLNPEGNPCYFTFELVLDTGETLYSSQMVEPSMTIRDITLNRAMERGEYDMTLQIRTYELDSLSAMNNANVKTILRVV